MTRALTTAVASAVTSVVGVICHLVELRFAGGTVSYTDAPVTIVATCTGAAASSWAAVGGVFELGSIEEGIEPGGYQMPLTLSGVDQTVLNLLLTDQYVFRTCSIWRAHFDASMVAVANPIPVFSGKMTGRWTYRRDGDTATIRTQLHDFFVDLDQVRGIPRTVEGHNAVMGITGDLLYSFVATLEQRATYWGGAAFVNIQPPPRRYLH